MTALSDWGGGRNVKIYQRYYSKVTKKVFMFIFNDHPPESIARLENHLKEVLFAISIVQSYKADMGMSQKLTEKGHKKNGDGKTDR